MEMGFDRNREQFMKRKDRMSVYRMWGLICGVCLVAAAVCAGCGAGNNILDGPGMERSYTQITQEKAKEMMEQDDGHIVVDVRRQEEYEEGHIPSAICIPNESIGTKQPANLPDLDQIILVYCRSGRRSKEAAQKLFDMGYANVYEFGGILYWTGEVVTEMAGTFGTPAPVLVVDIGSKRFYANLEDNASAEAFVEKLSPAAITVEMQDYGNFEKVGTLPWELPRTDEQITTIPGDIILYQGNQITLYYDENTWNFTKLANIEGVTKEELLRVLGDGTVEATLSLEWSE